MMGGEGGCKKGLHLCDKGHYGWGCDYNWIAWWKLSDTSKDHTKGQI